MITGVTYSRLKEAWKKKKNQARYEPRRPLRGVRLIEKGGKVEIAKTRSLIWQKVMEAPQ